MDWNLYVVKNVTLEWKCIDLWCDQCNLQVTVNNRNVVENYWSENESLQKHDSLIWLFSIWSCPLRRTSDDLIWTYFIVPVINCYERDWAQVTKTKLAISFHYNTKIINLRLTFCTYDIFYNYLSMQIKLTRMKILSF